MNFTWSAETDWRVNQAKLRGIANEAVKNLQDLSDKTILVEHDLTVAYVPIIMTESARKSYPARTRRLTKQRVAQCAPQLDHRLFVFGDDIDRIDLFYGGLLDALKPLKGFGLSERALVTFREVVGEAKELAKGS